MKFVSTIFVVTLLLMGWHRGCAQGFVNLNFESAKIIPLPSGEAFFPPYSVATTNAVPGWTVYYGFSGTSQQQFQITYNDPAAGSTSVSLLGTNNGVIDGNFSIYLQGSGSAPFAAISQTALTPVAAQSILFKAQANNGSPFYPVSLLISMNGQNIPFSAISTGSNYTLYGGNISSFAGQVAQLTLSVPNLGHDNSWNIDDIVFSPSPVPEPNTLTLGTLGALLLGFRRRRNSPH